VRPTLSRTAPATGTADVSSTPAGAMVKIDNTAVGLTPLRGRVLNVGRHRFEITAEGYEPYTASATVRENQTARIDAQLKEIPKPNPKAVAPPTPPPAPTPDPHVYDENDAALSAKPVKTTGKSAEYPKDALQLKRGQRASVTCSFVVLETGDVTDVQVIGVLPEGFSFPSGTQLYLPMELMSQSVSRTSHNYDVAARLNP
jgi:hypothetical protein